MYYCQMMQLKRNEIYKICFLYLLNLWIFYVFSVLGLLCLCARLFILCLVVTCLERADLLALVCGV